MMEKSKRLPWYVDSSDMYDPIEYVYDFGTDKDGEMVVELTQKVDIDKEVAAHEHEAGLKNILAQIGMGDYSGVRQPVYQDVTGFPDNVHDLKIMANTNQVAVDTSIFGNLTKDEIANLSDSDIKTLIMKKINSTTKNEEVNTNEQK